MINVVWFNGFKGNWDHGLLASIMDNDTRFVQHNSPENPALEEAIVIMGKIKDQDQARNYLAQLRKGIVILASDEDSEWDWRSIMPPHIKVWTQYYFRNKSEITDRLLLGAPTRIREVDMTARARQYSCSFVGQVQNPHRRSCVQAITGIQGHYLKIAAGFGGVNGLGYQDYINTMLESKVVLCPSGSMCTDSFRVYEALECGALPIVEARSPRDEKHFNYWRECGASLIPCVQNWSDAHLILQDHAFIEHKTTECIAWWKDYKIQLKNKLLTCLG